MENKRNENRVSNEENLNKQRRAVDKAPGEEREKGEQLTNEDLKGKKVDANPELREEQPIRQLP
ncbi:MAG: hypothetical protein JNK79_00660 [Chitinophagaceae bacterium]|nr:hypothetical protein [Chitinophagaceae bacterium]